MNNKFVTILAIAITFTITNSSALIRGGTTTNTRFDEEQQQHNNHFPSRRHLLEDESECTLYLKIISHPNGDDEECWSCEFPRIYAQGNFGGRDIMGINGLNKEYIDSRNAVSGESIMKITGAYVEQLLLDSSSAATTSASSSSNDDGEDIKLVVTNPAAVIIESITENDIRHHRYHKNRRRLSNKRNTGVIKTLVVRSTALNGSFVDASAAKLRTDVFDDEVCLKNQMEACSFNQLEIQPANVGDGGVVDIFIDINPIPDDTRNGNRGQLAQRAVAKTDELYGGNDGLAAEFDLVIFCLPPGSGAWGAFAYLNRYDSYYNNDGCSSSSYLMHEVGHSFGLSHAGVGGGNALFTANYADLTGYMGAGSINDDGPKMCYNAVKNYRLGWYDLQIGSTDPLDFIDEPTSFVLNGVADYKKNGSSNDELISLRLEQFGEVGVDFYLGYNRKAGVNSGVPQGGDKVILYSEDRGLVDAPSTRIVMLDIGESYIIDDYRGNGSTVTIKFDKLSSDMKDATITLSAVPPPPTAAPTTSCGGFGRFKVEIGIDKFEMETYWKLFEKDTNNLVIEGMDIQEYKANKITLEPTDGTAFCLDPGSCYDFKIYDENGDGLKPSQDGFYRGFLGAAPGGGAYTKIFEGGVFGSEDIRTFCVNDISPGTPTKPPTPVPTAVPTVFPTTGECSDDDDLLYKTVKKCNWVEIDKTVRCEFGWQGKLLKDFCPITCGLCQPVDPSTPVKSPTNAPTNRPTSAVSINNGICEDDADFIFKGAKTCAMGWIAKDLVNRCNLNAAELSAPNKLIKDYCKVLCNACAPNNNISCASNETPFKLELGIDNFGAETSWKIVRDSNGVELGSGSKEQYVKQTEYVESLCLPNGATYSFTIYDESGDGLKPNENGYYRGFVNNEIEFEGGVFNKEETKTFTITSTNDNIFTPREEPSNPPSTSASCDDNPEFRFRNKEKKNCEWLGRNKRIGKKICKRKKQGGIKVSHSCPSTCRSKFGVGPNKCI